MARVWYSNKTLDKNNKKSLFFIIYVFLLALNIVGYNLEPKNHLKYLNVDQLLVFNLVRLNDP